VGDQVKKNAVGRTCDIWEQRRGAYGILVGKSEGKRSLGSPRHRCEYNIKVGLQEVG